MTHCASTIEVFIVNEQLNVNTCIRVMSDLHDFIPLISTGLYLINKNSPRKWYVRPLNLKRSEQGEEQLVYDMRSMDDEKHFEYFRMSKSEFDELLKRTDKIMLFQSNL